MKKLLLIVILISASVKSHSQSLYFPPKLGEEWSTLSPEELGWCPDKVAPLLDFLETKNTKAFILLKDGKIVIEKYYGTFQQNDDWYWASAGKSLTAFVVGIAQQEQHFSIEDTTSDYLGVGWTSATPAKEEKITIRHQLTMTSGLDDGFGDHHCPDPSCLIYKADAGMRWAYHNGPYTLLDTIIKIRTGQTLNNYVKVKLKDPTGMNGAFIKIDYDNVFFSKPRSMARFGLLILNNGNWNGEQIMTDAAYFNDMVNTSQSLNPSYGYLWWLNGKASYKMPTLQINFPGPLSPNAPDDMIAALGKNGQIINIVPSQNLVFIRMGDSPEPGGEVPMSFNDDIWVKLNDLICTSTSNQKSKNNSSELRLYPNPSQELTTVELANQYYSLEVSDITGKVVYQEDNCFDKTNLNTLSFPKGFYYIRIVTQHNEVLNQKLICR